MMDEKKIPVFFRMYFTIRFNRPVDRERDYISPGGYELVMNGKTCHFDMLDSYMFVDEENPCLLYVEQRNPDYAEFECLKEMTFEDLSKPEKIEEFYIYTDTEGEGSEDDFLTPVEITELCFDAWDDNKVHEFDWQELMPYREDDWAEMPEQKEETK